MLPDDSFIEVFGSRQLWREPSGFWGYVRDDTHSIGSVTGAIIPWSNIYCRSFSMASLHSMGTLNLACCTGRKEGSRQIVFTPGMLPVVSNDWENAFLRETMCRTSFTVMLAPWSWNKWLPMAELPWSCYGWLPMAELCSGVTLGASWSCNALLWSWNALFLVC